MMYLYLRLIFNTWATYLIYIDRYENVNDLFNQINDDEIIAFVNKVYNNYKFNQNCKYILFSIHKLFKIIELFIQTDEPKYTFFKLTNIIKYNENNDIKKYKELFKIPIDDKSDTTELDLSFEIKKPNIHKYMESFMYVKTKLFEDEFKQFIKL